MNEDRAPTLIYNSRHSKPVALIAANVTGLSVSPSSLTATLKSGRRHTPPRRATHAGTAVATCKHMPDRDPGTSGFTEPRHGMVRIHAAVERHLRGHASLRPSRRPRGDRQSHDCRRSARMMVAASMALKEPSFMSGDTTENVLGRRRRQHPAIYPDGAWTAWLTPHAKDRSRSSTT